MATIAEQLTSLANTKTAIKDAIVAKGVAVSDSDTFRSYADKIGQIESGGGGESELFGITLRDSVGFVENGILYPSQRPFNITATGVDTIYDYALHSKFQRSYVKNIDFSSVKTLKQYALYNTFHSSYVEFVDFSDLETIENRGMYQAFETSSIAEIKLGSLISINSYGMYGAFRNSDLAQIDLNTVVSVGDNGLYNAFYNTRLEHVGFASLTTLGFYALYGAFTGTKITSISFPALTSVQSNSFGTSTSSSQTFRNCTELTEIHFRADMQATIEALPGYASKFGAVNATIYFDL